MVDLSSLGTGQQANTVAREEEEEDEEEKKNERTKTGVNTTTFENKSFVLLCRAYF